MTTQEEHKIIEKTFKQIKRLIKNSKWNNTEKILINWIFESGIIVGMARQKEDDFDWFNKQVIKLSDSMDVPLQLNLDTFKKLPQQPELEIREKRSKKK